MKKIGIAIVFVFLFQTLLMSGNVDITSAEHVARNFISEKILIDQENIKFESIYTKSKNSENYYYVFNLENEKGFVIISADDGYYPVIGYSLEGSFLNENQPEHITSFMNTYIDQIKYLRKNNVKEESEIFDLWNNYLKPFNVFTPTIKSGKAVDPLASDILWDQGSGWNDMCPEDEDGPGDHVYAGCVATAMGIILKYWNYPIHGTGSHSYYHPSYGTQSANFADATYFWNNMDNEDANVFSAHIIYHLAVSVDMGFSPDGSGAFSADVDDALEDYFGYSTSAQYTSRSSYNEQQWINLIKSQLDSDYPVYYSGSDGETGHAFVCSGYDDDDYFHFNFGWSGYNNGYYTVNDVGGFHVNQAAIVNIYPDDSYTYPNEPVALDAEIDVQTLNEFTVDLSWSAPSSKDVASYKIYRDLEEINEVSASQLSYSEITDPGNFYYSVAAVYQNGDESLTAFDEIKGLFSITFRVHDSEGQLITNNGINCQVLFNDETLATGFGSANFSYVPFGGDQMWEASADGHPTTTGYIDIIQDETFDITLNGGGSNINELEKSKAVTVFPNPANYYISIISEELLNDSQYIISDFTGRNILEGTLNDEKIIYTNNLQSGYYILTIYSNNTVLTNTFIINN